MRRNGTLLVSAFGIVALLVPASSAAAQPRSFWGVHAFDSPTVREAKKIRQAGAGNVRVQFHWRGIEPSAPDPDLGSHYEWQSTDRWVRNAVRGGLEIHATLIGSPSWLTARQDHAPPDSRAGWAGWRQFVRAVVERYGRGGSFWAENPGIPRRPVRIFQIWNEQNSSVRYKPRPNVRRYAKLLRISAAEIRRVDRRSRVVIGGMFGTPTAPNSIRGWTFLRRLYAIRGFRRRFDAVGVHPYAPSMRGVRYQMRQFHRVMRQAKDGRKPIEITEIGWSSARGDEHFFFQGPKGQARLLRQSFRLLLNGKRRWNIERIVWHAWRDTEGGGQGCSFCERFGLVREDLRPKPAYRAFTSFTKG